MGKPIEVKIRWMIRGDMTQVVRIDQQCCDEAWTEDEVAAMLRERHCVGLVAEYREKVVAFCVYDLLKTTVDVLKLAVAKEMQRRSIGTQFIVKLVGKLGGNRPELRVDVPERALGAQLFLKALGFRAIKILPPDKYDVENYRMILRQSEFSEITGKT